MILMLWFISTVVYVENDTLFFYANDKEIETWVLNQQTKLKDSLGITCVEKVKVAADSTRFFLYKEEYDRKEKKSESVIHLYSADKELLLTERRGGHRRIQLSLCRIYDDIVLIADCNLDNTGHSISIIKNGDDRILVKADQFLRVVNYAVSPNLCNFLFHTHRLHCDKAWDFLFFVNTETNTRWEYFFPICLSCKKTPISLTVFNSGKSEVVYKQEHRIFSKQGRLLEIFFE